jgi:tetratricopeptide (TPR) repeat protein
VQAGSQAMADRYAYLPFIGVFVAAVWGISDLLQRFRMSQYLVPGLICIVLVALGWRARVQESYWQNSIVLFRHALEVTTDNSVAHIGLATALAEKGLTDEAVLHIRAVLAVNPHDAVALESLALYHIYTGDDSDALKELNTAAGYAKYPDVQERIHMTLGALDSNLGNMEKAKSEYREAIVAQPEDYKPYLNLGVHLYLEGKYDEADAKLSQSIAIFPTSAAYYYRGETLEAEGKLQQAGEAYRKALEISPGYDEAKKALEKVLQRMQSASHLY